MAPRHVDEHRAKERHPAKKTVLRAPASEGVRRGSRVAASDGESARDSRRLKELKERANCVDRGVSTLREGESTTRTAEVQRLPHKMPHKRAAIDQSLPSLRPLQIE